MTTGIIIKAKAFFEALDLIESSIRIVAGRLNKTVYFMCKPDLKAILEAVEGLRAQYGSRGDFNNEIAGSLRLVEKGRQERSGCHEKD